MLQSLPAAPTAGRTTPISLLLDQLLDLEKNPTAKGYSEKEYNLDRFRAFLEVFGNPQQGQHFVHIAGTKGKGSTAAISEALLRGMGFPTALYSSPHLEHFGERLRFDGKPMNPARFEQALAGLYARLPQLQREQLESTHSYRTVFEVLTALALVEFRARAATLSDRSRPQVVCWETGLGGRLDCTNVVDPLVTVITTLAIDHTQILGDTIEKITSEKAGIIKPGRPVIVSRQSPEFADRVFPVLLARAAEVGAPIVRAWEHNPVLHSEPDPQGRRLRVRFPDGTEAAGLLPLRGQFQNANIEAAIAACWYTIRQLGVRPDPRAMMDALPLVDWPGRFEVLINDRRAILILDGAHCPLSAAALARSLPDVLAAPQHRRFVMLLGMQRDKDHAAFLRAFTANLGPLAIARVVTHTLPRPRGADASHLAAVATDAGLDAQAHDSFAHALDAAQRHNLPIVATGTMYSIAEFRKLWNQSHAPSNA